MPKKHKQGQIPLGPSRHVTSRHDTLSSGMGGISPFSGFVSPFSCFVSIDFSVLMQEY